MQAHGLDQNEGKTTWLSLQSSKTEERAMRGMECGGLSKVPQAKKSVLFGVHRRKKHSLSVLLF